MKDFADAIDKLTSFENFYLMVTLAEIITGKEIIPGTPNDIYQLIDWVREALPSLPSLGPASEYFDTVAEGEDAGFLDVIYMALKKSTLFGDTIFGKIEDLV